MAADMIQLDWGTDMATARRRLGTERRVAGNIDGRRRRPLVRSLESQLFIAVLGNVDPTVLFGSEAQVTAAVHQNIRDAGGKGQHLLNLGHGVLQGTPEASVAAFVNAAKSFTE